ncbi:MAG: DUF2802 domain-containing protein [Steroidobacteraceae bacterium]
MISIPNLPPLPIDALLYAGRAAFLVFSFALAAVAFVRLRRGAERRDRSAERDAQHTAAELARVLERLAAIESRIAANEPRLTALAEQIETHFKSVTAAASQNYAIAIRLARSGAKPDDLVAACGVARQEADLIARLHGRAATVEGDARHVALKRA